MQRRVVDGSRLGRALAVMVVPWFAWGIWATRLLLKYQEMGDIRAELAVADVAVGWGLYGLGWLALGCPRPQVHSRRDGVTLGLGVGILLLPSLAIILGWGDPPRDIVHLGWPSMAAWVAVLQTFCTRERTKRDEALGPVPPPRSRRRDDEGTTPG